MAMFLVKSINIQINGHCDLDLSIVVWPVHYLTYGPFSSHAPTYDSSFANISKEESDLLLSTYGDESGRQYADRFVHYTLLQDLFDESI